MAHLFHDLLHGDRLLDLSHHLVWHRDLDILHHFHRDRHLQMCFKKVDADCWNKNF